VTVLKTTLMKIFMLTMSSKKYDNVKTVRLKKCLGGGNLAVCGRKWELMSDKKAVYVVLLLMLVVLFSVWTKMYMV